MNNFDFRLGVLGLVVLILSACSAGSGEGLDEQGLPISGEGSETQPPSSDDSEQMTLATLQEQVLTPICAQCHAGNNAPLGLNMDSLENSTGNLINVASVTNPDFSRIAPGDADNSFFYMKITGNAAAGNRMPLGQAPLSSEIIADVRDWIIRGAPISSEQVSVAYTQVQSSLARISVAVGFSHDIEQQSLPASGFIWYYIEQGVKIEFSPVVTQYTWSRPNVVNIEIETPIAKKAIAFEINNINSATVLSQQGARLDGNGDGQPGGVFYHETKI